MSLFELDDVKVEFAEDDQFWLAPNAIVLGRVKLEAMVSVWFGAVLRGDNEMIHIKESSNIQDGSVLHTDPGFPLTVGKNCTVGHMAMLHGCTIGDNSLIGIGSTLLNGSIVGKNCIIGAHSLIPEKKSIPDNSLVMGTPGRVVRELKPDELATMGEASARYVEKWQRYKKGFRLQKN